VIPVPRSTKPGDEAPFVWASHTALDLALKVSGTSGVAVYIALCRLHSEAPPPFKNAFFASEANIGFHCGLSARGLRPILRELMRAKLISAAFVSVTQAKKYTVFSVHPSGTNCRTEKTAVRQSRSTIFADIKEVSLTPQSERDTSPPSAPSPCGGPGHGEEEKGGLTNEW